MEECHMKITASPQQPHSKRCAMNRSLRLLALGLTAAAVLGWLGLGANRGWTRTRVPVKIVDEVTGIEGIEYHNRFVPGVDLLGGALLVSGILAGVSTLFRNEPSKQIK